MFGLGAAAVSFSATLQFSDDRIGDVTDKKLCHEKVLSHDSIVVHSKRWDMPDQPPANADRVYPFG